MRYIKAAVFIGTISAVISIILFAAGWISTTPDILLRERIYQMPNALTVPESHSPAGYCRAGVRSRVDNSGYHAAGAQGQS